jgi:hypothetical protein
MTDDLSGSDAPKTFEEVVTWFTMPRREGSVGTHDETLLRELLAGMQARPGYSAPMTPAKAWNLILEHDLLYRESRNGWVTREGVMMGVAYAAHDRLLDYLGMTTEDADSRGWARVKRNGYQCRFRLTRKQRACIEDAGVLIDDGEEILKPRAPAR